VFLEKLCRFYQRLFRTSHPDQQKLVELHSQGDESAFLRAYFDHEYDKGLQMISRFSAITTEWHGGRALDFGCGAGGLTFRVREVSRQAIGIDLDPRKIDFARSVAQSKRIDNLEFVCYPGDDIPFSDGSFDVVFCVDVIEHLPTPETFAREFMRLLKPGGWLLLSFGPPWQHAHGKHMWSRLPGWWTHLIFPQAVVMRVCGFDPRTTYEDLGMFRLTVGKFEKIMRQSGFLQVFHENKINRAVRWVRNTPVIRGFFISEVVGIYRKQSAA